MTVTLILSTLCIFIASDSTRLENISRHFAGSNRRIVKYFSTRETDKHIRLANFSLCSWNKVVDIEINTVLVFGATSFLGASISVYLKDINYNVIPIENMNSIPHEPMGWQRWNYLVKNDLLLQKVFYYDDKEIILLLKANKPDAIVYIPSLVFDGQYEGNLPYKSKLNTLSTALKDFVRLLEIVRLNYIHTKIIFPTLPETFGYSIQTAWLKAFQLLLSSYEHVYYMNVAFIKVSGVYGPWQGHGEKYDFPRSSMCYNIRDVCQEIVKLMETSNRCVERTLDKCETSKNSEVGLKLTFDWVAEYKISQIEDRSVIMSQYFTSVESTQYHKQFSNSNFRFMQKWFSTAAKLGVKLVIFHDGISDQFQKDLKDYYSNVEFVKVDGFRGRTQNDVRYYLQYDYLIEHPEISRIITTDMRDVAFLANPFDVMMEIGDYLYVGVDNSFHLSAWSNKGVSSQMKICHSKDLDMKEVELQPFFNSGVTGGTRHYMLAYLTQMIWYFNRAPPRNNCNMATVAVVYHRHFRDVIFSGYPFQSAYKIGIIGPKFVAIKHKIAGGNNIEDTLFLQ